MLKYFFKLTFFGLAGIGLIYLQACAKANHAPVVKLHESPSVQVRRPLANRQGGVEANSHRADQTNIPADVQKRVQRQAKMKKRAQAQALGFQKYIARSQHRAPVISLNRGSSETEKPSFSARSSVVTLAKTEVNTQVNTKTNTLAKTNIQAKSNTLAKMNTQIKAVNKKANNEKNRREQEINLHKRKSPENRNNTQKESLVRHVNSSHLVWHWPTRGKLLHSFQENPNGGRQSRGIDIAGVAGSPIKASSSGVVVYSGNALKSYGNLIIIKHSEKFLSAYAHNQEILVKEGDQVKIGQVIAKMGKTGSDKVKLHFEIRYQGKPINPLKFLPKA